jgi:hypothetical protein
MWQQPGEVLTWWHSHSWLCDFAIIATTEAAIRAAKPHSQEWLCHLNLSRKTKEGGRYGVCFEESLGLKFVRNEFLSPGM